MDAHLYEAVYTRLLIAGIAFLVSWCSSSIFGCGENVAGKDIEKAVNTVCFLGGKHVAEEDMNGSFLTSKTGIHRT